jgi:predicted DNA-binding protein (UPF0251 family)
MNRWIRHQPIVQFYKPQGVPMGQLRGITLSLDGLEALRLADAEGLEHEQAAEMMGISRPTFSRLLAEARAIVAKGLVNGWAIRIEGGNYKLAGEAPPRDRGRRRCRRGAGTVSGQIRSDIPMSTDETGASAEMGKGSETEPIL